MLALFAVFEHFSNVRRLLNRFSFFHTTTPEPSKSTEEILLDVDEVQREILLGPVLHRISADQRVNYFDQDFRDDLKQQEEFARELDACLLEMREIERDLYNFKQRQCQFYESYLDFIEKKDQLIDDFIAYHDEYFANQPHSTARKDLRRQSTIYEFNIPVSNRFELFKRQQAQQKI